MLEMAEPRSSVLNSLHASRKLQNGKNIFWTTLRSLMVMEGIIDYDFDNHPSVRSHLLEFLSLNTQVEAVEKLTTKVKELESTNKNLAKELKGAVTAASTASNRVKELENEQKQMKKDLKAIQAKL